MTIMMERMTVGSHGTEEEAESLHVETTTMSNNHGHVLGFRNLRTRH